MFSWGRRWSGFRKGLRLFFHVIKWNCGERINMQVTNRDSCLILVLKQHVSSKYQDALLKWGSDIFYKASCSPLIFTSAATSLFCSFTVFVCFFHICAMGFMCWCPLQRHVDPALFVCRCSEEDVWEKRCIEHEDPSEKYLYHFEHVCVYEDASWHILPTRLVRSTRLALWLQHVFFLPISFTLKLVVMSFSCYSFFLQ